jgi:NAD(P)-dependent dehydrogenase (short-subunit alcohol dehydrogenase family)
MGQNHWLQGKTVAVTGASGTMGRALLNQLLKHQANPVAITTSPQAEFPDSITRWVWQPGQEADLQGAIQGVDILIINHGLNVHSDRTPAAIQKSLEVNALSGWRLMEVFLSTVDADSSTTKEVWVNTSEAEVGPAFSPLYEISNARLESRSGELERLPKVFPRQCSSGCPPWNVQPVMGGQYQQTRLSVEAPSEPIEGAG